MGSRSNLNQRGMSLISFIILLGIVGMLGVLGLKTVPTVFEYFSIKKAVAYAKQHGNDPIEIRQTFDQQATVSYITSLRGKDLQIQQGNGGYEVSFSYEKVIPLVGPASLLLEYEGGTERQAAPTRAIP